MHTWAVSPRDLKEVWGFLWNKLCTLRAAVRQGSALQLGWMGQKLLVFLVDIVLLILGLWVSEVWKQVADSQEFVQSIRFREKEVNKLRNFLIALCLFCEISVSTMSRLSQTWSSYLTPLTICGGVCIFWSGMDLSGWNQAEQEPEEKNCLLKLFRGCCVRGLVIRYTFKPGQLFAWLLFCFVLFFAKWLLATWSCYIAR